MSYELTFTARQGEEVGTGSVTIDVAVPPGGPFGVGFFALDTAEALRRAHLIGGRFFRNAYFAISRTYQHDPAVVAASGFDTLLNVYNVSYVFDGMNPPPPSSPMANKAAFQSSLSAAIQTVHPWLVVVENEAGYWGHFSGTPAQYASELAAAAEVCESAGILVANDGPVSGSVAGFLYSWLAFHENRLTDAEAFWAGSDGITAVKPTHYTPGNWFEITAAPLVGVSGARFNFHSYGWMPSTIKTAVASLAAFSGIPAISNEWGRRGPDTDRVGFRAVLQAWVDAGVDIAQMWSVDAPTGTRSIFNSNGTLRPTGEEMAAFVASNFGGSP